MYYDINGVKYADRGGCFAITTLVDDLEQSTNAGDSIAFEVEVLNIAT